MCLCHIPVCIVPAVSCVSPSSLGAGRRFERLLQGAHLRLICSLLLFKYSGSPLTHYQIFTVHFLVTSQAYNYFLYQFEQVPCLVFWPSFLCSAHCCSRTAPLLDFLPLPHLPYKILLSGLINSVTGSIRSVFLIWSTQPTRCHRKIWPQSESESESEWTTQMHSRTPSLAKNPEL